MSKENNSAVENNINEAAAKDTPAPAAFTQSVPILSSITKTVKSDDDTPNKETQYGSFADNLYQKINSVIGGSNPNQFLCLTIPGQALSADDFSYDYKNNAPKGPVIEANESRLANKLFDPCRMTGGDNGLTLPYQYRTALDMLTPKLNAKVAEAKIPRAAPAKEATHRLRPSRPLL